MQKWQHIAPKLYIKPSTTSITILFNTNVIKAVSGERWTIAMNCSLSHQAQTEQGGQGLCLKEMGQYLALDLMKILQLQM